jgi:hypothetical protein
VRAVYLAAHLVHTYAPSGLIRDKPLNTITKSALIGILLIGTAWYFGLLPSGVSLQLPGDFDAPPTAMKLDQDSSIKIVEFTELFASRRPLKELVSPGHYTVVEVYLDSCGICKRLESNFPAFRNARTDVQITRVHFPEDGIHPRIEAQSQAEMQRKVAELNADIQSYQICGTPHIEVYDPAGKVLAKDECGNKTGLRYLRNWIGDEIGVSANAI